MKTTPHSYNGSYRGRWLDRITFPLGGMGAGMIGFEGTGAFSHVAVRHRPEMFAESRMFAAICVKGRTNIARVLEGPVPHWKVHGRPGIGAGRIGGMHFGLPRFDRAGFRARFPFGSVRLSDRELPLKVGITGWSPFVPGDADSASLPVAGVEYRLANPTRRKIEAVFSFHALNFLSVPPADGEPRGDTVERSAKGFVLGQGAQARRPWLRGAFCAEVDAANSYVDCALFRGGNFDPLTMIWRHIVAGDCVANPPPSSGDPSPGGSLYVPLSLAPGQTATVRLRLSWYVPASDLHTGEQRKAPAAKPRRQPERYRPWYAARFPDIGAVAAYWRDGYDELRRRTRSFTDCFHDSTLPPEALEAITANLTILKSTTCLRQHDGRFWGWEGSGDNGGCCPGSCQHVWNYAQALPHLFPALERTLRETEFGPSQDGRGHQNFRASLPIGPVDHDFFAAADGQLGGIIKVHREWRVSGDTAWLKKLWPRIRRSLDYCIRTWDPAGWGVIEEPHHNTYDIEFWGPNGLAQGFYLGALRAAVVMAAACGDEAERYARLLALGRRFMKRKLWNGEYFIQRMEWRGLRAGDPAKFPSRVATYSAEARQLLRREGPKYQYGPGCLADGVIGIWLAGMCGVAGPVLDARKVKSHLRAVHRHNFRHDLARHPNPQRHSYALGTEAGLLLCTWPRGGKPALPFIYCDEIWTGIEYQVASHLMSVGCVREGLEIVRAVRDRYDGRVRNPFDEFECGHWYARAMSSYALLQGLTGAQYDAVDQTLRLAPRVKGDFRSFLCTASGYGTVGVKRGRPFLQVKAGVIPVKRVEFNGRSFFLRGPRRAGLPRTKNNRLDNES